MKRLIKRLFTNYKIAKLGQNFFESFKVFIYFSLLPFIKKDAGPFKLIFNGVKFSLKFHGKHEEYFLIKEIFVDQEYKIDISSDRVHKIIDLGSNIGYSAIYFSCCFPEASIYAVEPSKDTFSRLQENTLAIKNIEILNFAVSDRDGEMIFFENKDRNISSSVYNRGEEFQKVVVNSITFQSLLKKLGISRIDILKFDIEGGEQFLSEQDICSVDGILVGELHADLMGEEKTLKLLNIMENNFSVEKESLNKNKRYVIRAKRITTKG